MEYFGVFAFVLVMCYLSVPGKVKKLEAKVKRLEKQRNGAYAMSKLMQQLIGKTCTLISEKGLSIAGKCEFTCEILDCDEEWVKIRLDQKKGGKAVKMMRLEDIESVELTDEQ